MSIKESIKAWDVRTLFYIQGHFRNGFLTALNRAFSFMGDASWFFISVCIAMMVRNFYSREAKYALVSLLVSSGFVNLGFKRLFKRERPYITFRNLEVLCHKPKDYSFPSGHTAVALAAGFFFLFTMPLWFGLPAVSIALLIGLSRIYLGVHYPSDVIAGSILAFCVSFSIFAAVF